MVHASQFHFFDLIFMSFVGVLLWFNPFVFLLLRSVRENHEYIADDQSSREPGALVSYLACLRDETIRRYSPTVASYFKSSTIKKRIIMLTNHHSKGYSTFYAHLESISVKAGDQVKKGQEVATVGSTGQSTGPHLHYEVRKDGTHVNPADYY